MNNKQSLLEITIFEYILSQKKDEERNEIFCENNGIDQNNWKEINYLI